MLLEIQSLKKVAQSDYANAPSGYQQLIGAYFHNKKAVCDVDVKIVDDTGEDVPELIKLLKQGKSLAGAGAQYGNIRAFFTAKLQPKPSDAGKQSVDSVEKLPTKFLYRLFVSSTVSPLKGSKLFLSMTIKRSTGGEWLKFKEAQNAYPW